jgi:hypothetical protein
MRVRIVSGGQTGVDRGALDAALEAGGPCGGWCPQGRVAEDGTIPEKYPLRELPGAGYAERTRRNVSDSDGTLVLSFAKPGRGTALTRRHAKALGKPLLVLDCERVEAAAAARAVRAFISAHGIGTLNVAGPRASTHPGAYRCAREIIGEVLRQ